MSKVPGPGILCKTSHFTKVQMYKYVHQSTIQKTQVGIAVHSLFVEVYSLMFPKEYHMHSAFEIFS